MRCPSCHSDNRDSAKFCDECGAKLTATRVPSAPRSLPRRVAAVDWLLLGVVLPICVFGIVMNVIHGVRGDFVVAPFWAMSAPDQQSYPFVGRLFSYANAGESSLAVGDRLLRLGEDDLKGVSTA